METETTADNRELVLHVPPGTRSSYGPPPHYSLEQIVQALANAGGIKTDAAKLLGCNRKTLARYLRNYPELIEYVRTEVKPATADLAESGLLAHLQAGYWPAIKFYLSTQCKDEGWSERVETHHDGSITIEAKVVPSDDDDLRELSDAEVKRLIAAKEDECGIKLRQITALEARIREAAGGLDPAKPG